MNNIFKSLVLSFVLFLSSCAITKEGINSKAPHIRLASYLVAQKVIKDSDNKDKTKNDILKISKTLNNTSLIQVSSPQEFKTFIYENTKIDKSAEVVIDSIYLIFKDEIGTVDNTNLEKVNIVLKYVSEGFELAAS